MRRCPDCGFRTEDKVCPLCGVKTKETDIPVHTHTQKGETCRLPNQTRMDVPRPQPVKPVQQSGQKPQYVRKNGQKELPLWQLLLILVAVVIVMRSCGVILLS